MSNSPEFRAVSTSTGILVDGITADVERYAEKFRDEELIISTVYNTVIQTTTAVDDAQKARSIVQSITANIKARQHLFFELLEVLKELGLTEQAEKVENKYIEFKGILPKTKQETNVGKRKEEKSNHNHFTRNAGIAAAALFCGISICVVLMRRFIFHQASQVDDFTFPSKPIVTDNEKLNLFSALSIVGNWNSLCTHLGVDSGTIEEIYYSGEGVVNKRQKCLTAYYDSGRADWGKVVTVVANRPISKRKRACDIANKYMGMDKETCMKLLDQQKQ